MSRKSAWRGASRTRHSLAWTQLVLCLATFCLLIVGNTVQASSNYGSGPYGSCGYQVCSQTTQTTLPSSGLQVDINLHDGQVIPQAGYNIVVTPLNGQGTTFKQVDFYINGTLAISLPPAEDGTVQWFWNPSQFPGTDIKIVVTDQDGQSVTEEFHITIGSVAASTAPSATNSSSSPSVLQQISNVAGSVLQGGQKIVQQLPPVIKNSLPYFLFLILAIDLLLLLLQFRREVSEVRTLQNLVTRERQSGQLKKMLVDLMSHYLRTPLSIISGAMEMSTVEGIAPSVLNDLNHDLKGLNAEVETLIGQATTANNIVRLDSTPSPVSPRQFWRQPLLVLPVVLVGVVVIVFDFLVQHDSDFNINQVNLIIQAVVFSSLVVGLYLVLRRLELHRHDVVETERVLQGEVTFNHRRDQLIDETALELSRGLSSLDSDLAKIGQLKVSKLVRRGQTQLHDVVEKCAIARQLKGVTASEPLTPTQLSRIASLTQALDEKVRSKGIRINIAQDMPLLVRNPDLLTFVMRTVLDNAIEYSPTDGHIEVVASQAGNKLTITITDHGSGIPDDKKFVLFQAFSKVGGTEVLDHAGTGMSLYLDKLIMSYLLGNIMIEASEPQGTRVVLTLPARSAKAA